MPAWPNTPMAVDFSSTAISTGDRRANRFAIARAVSRGCDFLCHTVFLFTRGNFRAREQIIEQPLLHLLVGGVLHRFGHLAAHHVDG